MFKLCFFLWRRADFSHRQFADYYENNHAPLGASLSPPMPDYRRNYPEWEGGEAPSEALSFDVMTQIWHKRREDFANQLAIMTRSPAKETISTDEARFMNRDRQLFLALDERGFPAPGFETDHKQEDHGSGYKMLRFVKAQDDLSIALFRDRYEAEIAPRLGVGSNVKGYRRSYALLDDEYSFSGGAQNILPIDPAATVFDMIEEFWLPEGFDEDQIAQLHRKGIDAGLVDDQRTFRCRARECRSPGGQFAAPFHAQQKVSNAVAVEA